MLRVLKPPTFKPVSQQMKIAARWGNTDFWLDKITREPRHTREICHQLQNKFALGW